MPKENLIFKLDNLEYQYHHLNNSLDGFQPRLKNTSKTFNAKGKKTSKKINKLLNDANLGEVNRELDSLRTEIVEKKTFHLESKLTASLEKALQQQYSSLLKKHTDKNEDKLQALAELDRKHTISVFAKIFAKSRACKLLVSKITPSKALKENPPKWFEENEYFQIFQDKTNKYNPSRVWNEVVVATTGCEKVLSQAMAGQKVKELLKAFDSGMDLFLNIKREKDAVPLKVSQKTSAAAGSSSGSEFEDETDNEGAADERKDLTGQNLDSIVPEDMNEEEILKQYEGMLVASDEEEDENAMTSLDPSINYNEITDEEPSDSESEFNIALSEDDIESEPALKRQKKEDIKKKGKSENNVGALPELMAGYYSGDSDDDISEDEVAAKQISNEPKRKNRRGQRARQKIWEKKYGKSAMHVQKRIEEERSEREQKQLEYEQRVAKRAAKVQEREATQAQEHFTRKPREEKPQHVLMHPSWEAKKQAEEKQKAAKFQGKKIVF
ncbi:LANO_0D04412g1_1 [Lachancea nothofagi CBS 11611]|uniref:LANO_0D04412g1_1 n=1 Tax=Lachancea nothofagi CBS 11611 TaxID=1266666 RepID=A0A1G4JGJ0_9SACH|nr:LANO_0D04412g1_1 [Lachancea nothofagi CBS 11611]